ncbi:unnamed protein product, partial [Ectocarpus sp. 13 AM-2016]
SIAADPVSCQGSKPRPGFRGRRGEALQRWLAALSGRTCRVFLPRSLRRPRFDVRPAIVQFLVHLGVDGRGQVSFALVKVLRVCSRQSMRLEKVGVLVRRGEEHGGVAEGRRVGAVLVPNPPVQLLHEDFGEQLPSLGGDGTQGSRLHHLVRQRLLFLRDLLVRLLCFRGNRRRRDVEHLQRLVGVEHLLLEFGERHVHLCRHRDCAVLPVPSYDGKRLEQREELEDVVFVFVLFQGKLLAIIGVDLPQDMPQADDALHHADEAQPSLGRVPRDLQGLAQHLQLGLVELLLEDGRLVHLGGSLDDERDHLARILVLRFLGVGRGAEGG